MAKDFSLMEDSNRSSNPSIHEVSAPSRRTLLRGGLGALAGNFLAPLSTVAGAAALVGCATLALVLAPCWASRAWPFHGRHGDGARGLHRAGDRTLG